MFLSIFTLNPIFSSFVVVVVVVYQDLFHAKFNRFPLQISHPEFKGVTEEEGIEWILKQFLSTSGSTNRLGRQIYSHVTCATDINNSLKVLQASLSIKHSMQSG
jgi:hypothetical protein